VIRRLRVVRDDLRLQHRVDCRWCGKLVWFVNFETLYRLRVPNTRIRTTVLHTCQRIAPGRQLLHKGRSHDVYLQPRPV
jgi:hypothetical protein